MDLAQIARALQRSETVSLAIRALRNYNDPLTEKEVTVLTEFNKERIEQLEAGLKVEEMPQEIADLTTRPATAVHPLAVVQCVMSVSRIPDTCTDYHRQLQKQVLPLVVRLTPLTLQEWAAALNFASQLPISTSRTSLRCVEEVLRLSGPVVFDAPQPALTATGRKKQRGAVPRKATTELKLREANPEEVRKVYLKVLAEVTRQYAALHDRYPKHSLTVPPKGNEVFWQSRPLHRLQRFTRASASHDVAAFVAAMNALVPLDTFTVATLTAEWTTPLTKEQLTNVIKASPGSVAVLLGGRAICPGTLPLAKPAEAVQACLYNMGLTTVTQAGFEDYLSVLLAMKTDDLASYLLEKGKDAFAQLLVPFVTHQKTLTSQVVEVVAPRYAELFAQLQPTRADRAALATSLMQACVQVVSTRCRSTPEKASVLRLVGDMIEKLPAEFCTEMEKAAEWGTLLNREIALPAAESAQEAMRLASLLALEAAVTDGLMSALKTSKKDEEVRRALLVHLSLTRTPEAVVDELTASLLEDCMEVEVVRPDAFLALGFTARRQPASAVKLCGLLSTADVLAALNHNRYEQARAAEVAIILASIGQCAPLVMLLTSSSGRVRLPLKEYVKSVSGDAAAVITMWDHLTKVVFGLEAAAKPRIMSQTASNALIPIASALLSHTAKLSVTTALSELLLCCAHDHVQGADPAFFKPNHRRSWRHTWNGDKLDLAVVRHVFNEESVALLLQHCPVLTDKLLETALHQQEHTSIAACRAVTLLLSCVRLVAHASDAVFPKLLARLKTSTEYFLQLDERDRAIAAGTVDAQSAYEDSTLRDQQVLKTYPSRPPKGMSEDDFMDMKKKDAIALAKAREALQTELAKRTRAIRDVVQQNKTIFAAIRVLGVTGSFDVNGTAVLYPYLQSTLNGVSATVPPPAVLADLCLDAVVGLLARTPLALMAENVATTVARLCHEKHLAVRDVAQISTMAQLIRMSLPQMLPAPLFVLLVRFARVAFKAGSGSNAVSTTIPAATQHQLLGVLLQNLGQPNLPEPNETLELLSSILHSFPSLFKSIQQGFHALMSMIPAANLSTIEAGLFNTVNSVREVTAASFGRFAHFLTCRRALVLAAVFLKDESVNVVKSMTAIVTEAKYSWKLLVSDWGDLMYFLATYGQLRSNALRIVLTMKELFELPETTEAQQIAWLKDIMPVGGLGSIVAMETLSSTYHGTTPAVAMDYLCSLLGSISTGEALMKSVLSAGRVVLKQTDLTILKQIAPEFQARLAKPPKDASPAQREQYLATATVWLTIISCRLQETELLEAIIEQQSRILNSSLSAMVHRCVCDSMVEITKNAEVRQSPKLDEFVEKCLKQVIHSGSYVKKKAHAWGMVGVLQGLGLTSLRRYHILEQIHQAGRDKQTEKSGAMVLVEVMCDVMGTKIEPYALNVSQLLLEGVADPDPKVSECADDAARVMMSSLSSVGLRQLIPRLVASLSADQAKKRVAPLNFIGYVAFCSPKQLAATLPEIMKHITGCLFDINSAVSVAALNALRRVAGVVSNPEIQEHVDLILNAMRSPSTDTEAALDALLYTRFINVVDPASLALIIPVISRGLSGQMPHTRPKAAQIVASMVSLVNDPKTLSPYTDDLVRLLEEASQDPQAEARTTSAKAMAALAAAIGGTLVDQIATWSFGVLQRVQSGTIEKAGAAQVFVELVSSCGDDVLQVYFPVIEAGMLDEKPPVREGFLYIMVYAPSTFSTTSFQNFLPVSFPWILEGLSHFSDKVRDVALVAGDSVISLYGTRNLSLVLEPLLTGVVSEVTTLRHSSILLSSKLLLHLVAHIKKKMRIQAALENAASAEEETREETPQPEGAGEAGAAAAGSGTEESTGVLTMEAAREVEKRGISILGSLEEMLGTDQMVRLLSAIFCGRHEASSNVRSDANLAWQACVASIRAAVNKIFDGLTQLLVHFGSSENLDCVEVAQKTIEFTTRMNETIERFVDSFCDTYKSGSRRARLGSLVCLSSVVQFTDSKRLMGMGGQIVGCVLPGMQDKDEAVQEAAREVFGRVSRSVGSRLIESAVEAQLATSVRGVVEVVKVKPSIALALVFKYLGSQTEYTPANLELLDAVLGVEEAEDDLRRYNEDVVRLFLAFLVQGLDGAGDAMRHYIETCPREFEQLPIDYFQKALNVPEKRLGALLAAEAYGLGTDIENTDGISAVFRAVLTVLGDEEDKTRLAAVRALHGLINSLEQRVVESLDEEEQQDVTTSKRAAGRYLIQYLDVFHTSLSVTARATITKDHPEFMVLGEGEPRLFDVLMSFYNRGLDYGTAQQKVEGVECIQDLIEFAPRAISASAVNTVAGRCSKVLFTRNDGSVVLALVRLCLQLMSYPASGKEKMVEGTMALAMFNAALCDSGEARVLALRVVIQLLQRSEKYADLILGTVVTKKAAVDSPLLRTVMCRFISTVIRYANFEKAFPHVTKLMEIVLPWWEAPDSPAQAAAAGAAVGALCKSASIKDDQLSDIKERTLATTSTKGVQALAGFATVYSLITCAPSRTDQTFLDVAAEHLRTAASFGAGDKLTTLWMLRAAAAIATTGCVSQETFRPEVYLPLLRRVDPNDEVMLSTSQFFFESVVATYPATTSVFEAAQRDKSTGWNLVHQFDADLDDEGEANSVY